MSYVYDNTPATRRLLGLDHVPEYVSGDSKLPLIVHSKGRFTFSAKASGLRVLIEERVPGTHRVMIIRGTPEFVEEMVSCVESEDLDTAFEYAHR